MLLRRDEGAEVERARDSEFACDVAAWRERYSCRRDELTMGRCSLGCEEWWCWCGWGWWGCEC